MDDQYIISKNEEIKKVWGGWTESGWMKSADRFIYSLTGLHSGSLHLHDAVFEENEQVVDAEISEVEKPYREPNWWDEEAIQFEFGDKPKSNASIESKIEWYLKNELEK
jgi:hypothetical protein